MSTYLAGLSAAKTLCPDAAQRHRPRLFPCGDRSHARASVGSLCSRQKTTSPPPRLRRLAQGARQPAPGSACAAAPCSHRRQHHCLLLEFTEYRIGTDPEHPCGITTPTGVEAHVNNGLLHRG